MGNYTNQMMDRDFGPVGPYSEEADERFLAEQMKNPPLGRAVNPDPQIEQKKMQNDQAERASAKAMDEQGLLKPHEKQMAVNQWGPFWKDIKEFGGKVGGVLSGMGDDLASGASSMNRRVQNDPKLAMAIAMAGFNIADPDSGFTNNPRDPYSAFRALKSGLGSGLQTYAQLSKPRELGFAEQERIKNMYKLQQIEAEAGSGKNMGEYRRVLQNLRILEKQNPEHPDIPYLKAKLDKMTRLDPSSRGKDFDLMTSIRKKYGENSPEMKDFLAVGPKGFSMSFGDTKKIIGPDGKVIFSGDVNLGPSETAGHAGDIEKAKLTEKRKMELSINRPKDRLSLSQALRKSEGMSDWIGKAKELASGSWWATGGAGALADMAPWSTPASKLNDYLTTLKANLGFDKLQEMREASATGGALGQVSELENKLLQAVNGALNPKNKEVLLQNLTIIETLYPIVLGEKKQMYLDTYGEEWDSGRPEGVTAREWQLMTDDQRNAFR